MPTRAAIVTGASRGIGFAIAETLAAEGYALTLTARKPEGLEAAAEKLRAAHGGDVTTYAVNIADEDAVSRIVTHHRNTYGRLDVLVNNAGLGIGAGAADHQLKHIDLQTAVNFRALVLFYKETADLLRAAGAEHGEALVVNLGSIAGKGGQPFLSVYGATKAAVISYTESMNKELRAEGIKSVALCPGFVDTDMTDFVKEHVGVENMIKTSDIANAVRFLLTLSPACLVPEITFRNPGDQLSMP